MVLSHFIGSKPFLGGTGAVLVQYVLQITAQLQRNTQ
jgi:hypothetical protein